MEQPASHRALSSTDAALQKRWQETMSRLSFLDGCSRLFLDHVKMRLESRFLGPGIAIFNEGDEGDELFVLLRGSAESLGGERFEDGALLGDPVLLLRAGVPRAITVRTTDFCDLQVICRRAFQEAGNMFPCEARRVANRIAPKLPSAPMGSSRNSTPRSSTPRASTPRASSPRKRCTRQGSFAFSDIASDGSPSSPKNVSSTRARRSSLIPYKRRPSTAQKTPDNLSPEGGSHRLSLKLSSLCSSTKLASMARKCMLGSVTESEGVEAEEGIAEHGKPRTSSFVPGWAYTAVEEDEAARRELAAWLDTIHFFANMDAFCFERLLPLFERRRFKEGEKVLEEGVVTEAIHVIYAGDAHVIVNGIQINTVGPGSIVGARTMLASGVQQSKGTASIVAASSIVSTVALPRGLLYDLFRTTPLMHQQLEDLWNSDTGKQDLGERTIYDTWLFHGCDPQFARLLENTIEQRFIAPGTAIINEGEESTNAYLMVLGVVNILIKGEIVDTVVVNDYCGAKLFGEVALLGISPARSASVVAETAVRVQVICAEPLRKAFDQFPDASAVFRRLAEDRMNADSRRNQPPDPSSETHGDGRSPASEKKAWLPLTPASLHVASEAVERSTSRAVESRKSMAALGEQLIVSCDLGTTKHMCNCSASFLDALSEFLSERLYMPQQVLMREGKEMDEVFVLQNGQCSVSWHGEELATIEGPCMIGSMMALVSPSVVTTVVADITCWVAIISKQDFAAVLDRHPEDRKLLLGLAHASFSELCEEFDDTVDNHLETSLMCLPALKGASSGFLSTLTTVVKTRLVLPGTVIAKEHARDQDSAKLYILFEGYCHFLKDGTVVSTLRGGTIFGEMGVFGLPDEGSRNVQVRAVELCKLGTVDKLQFLDALARFPEERGRFERIVHGRLEDTVHATVARLPCFEGLPNHFVSKLRLCLARHLVQEGQVLIREGDAGESMFVVNCGKMEISYSGIVVGMLWPGKAFGAPQLLGITREYHATLRAKKTCHVLAFSRSALSAMVLGPAERQWKAAWEHRAQAAYESELQAFKRKCREQRCMARVGQQMGAAISIGGVRNVLLCNIFAAWRKAVGRQKRGSLPVPRRLMGSRLAPPRPSALPGEVPPEVMQMAPPMMFSRRLRRVALESHSQSADSPDPLHWARDGRMDCWKGASTPRWLTATREEIGKQIVAHKANARGEKPLGLSTLAVCHA